jgi:hypothetical protein
VPEPDQPHVEIAIAGAGLSMACFGHRAYSVEAAAPAPTGEPALV